MSAQYKDKLKSSLNKLEERLFCAICLDHFTDPKTLPCLHSFCLQCLESLTIDPQRNTLSCPTCRQYTPLPAGTAGGFPSAFHLNDLRESFIIMKKAVSDSKVACDNCSSPNITGFCKECNKFLCSQCIDMHNKWGDFRNHIITRFDEEVPPITCSAHKKKVKVYCETCDELICRDCTIKLHEGHNNNAISDIYNKYCHELERNLVAVKKRITAFENVLNSLTERENEIKAQKEAIEKEILDVKEEMVQNIHESARHLTEKLETATNSKLQVLSEQKTLAEKSLGHLKDCEKYVEHSIGAEAKDQFLLSKKHMRDKINQVTNQHNVEQFHPIEKPDIEFIKDDVIVVKHIGDIVYTSLQQCKVEEITQVERPLPKEKNVSFPLSLSVDSCLLTVPVSSISCSLVPPVSASNVQPIETTITTTTQPGIYRVCCSPSTNGYHVINVKVYDVPLEDTSLIIPFHPYLDTITPFFTVSELNRPYGVAANDDGHVIITELADNCISMLNKEGKVKSIGGNEGIGNVKFNSPRGIAITHDNFILVTDDHRIQKITIDGEHIKSVGKRGNGKLEFFSPSCITIHPTSKHIYIADWCNHRIQVLTPQLIYHNSFGEEGTAQGQFKAPRDIGIDRNGLLYVADWGNDRIQVFTPEGQFIRHFGTAGTGPGQLKGPLGITVDKFTNLVYVTEEYNNRISIFDIGGNFINCYNKDQFNSPKEIFFDGKRKLLYVCDSNNHRLLVF